MTSREAWNKSWDVNVVGAHMMTLTFLPSLLKSLDPRLIFLTSGLASLTDSADSNDPRYALAPASLPKDCSSNMFAYRSSKAGLNMVIIEWYKQLANDHVRVWACSPGFCATGS